jgi:hypothetical protein
LVRDYIRLKTENVADEGTFVAPVIAHLAGLIDEVHALHPLVNCEVNFASEVVEVAD